jgi:hypothetical protein
MQDEPPIQEMSRNSGTSWNFPGSLGSLRTDPPDHGRVEQGERAKISQFSDDVSYGNSSHDVGDGDATTTRLTPGVPMQKGAR